MCIHFVHFPIFTHTHTHTVPQPKVLLSAVQKGSTELVSSILSDITSQITPTPPTVTTEIDSTPSDTTSAAKPVSETGKTSSAAAIDETGKTGFILEGRRKRKSEPISEPVSRKKRKSKNEREGERESSAATVATNIGRKGAEFDVGVVVETGINNCNVLHVCCGAVASVSVGTGESASERRLGILERILSCVPLRLLVTRLVSTLLYMCTYNMCVLCISTYTVRVCTTVCK